MTITCNRSTLLRAAALCGRADRMMRLVARSGLLLAIAGGGRSSMVCVQIAECDAPWPDVAIACGDLVRLLQAMGCAEEES